MKLSIQEIADLKEGRKTLDEITKTHDGTNVWAKNPDLKSALNNFGEKCSKESEEYIRYTKDGVFQQDGTQVSFDKDRNRLTDEEMTDLKKDNYEECHFTTFYKHNTNGDWKLHESFKDNDCLPPMIDKEDIFLLGHTNKNGEYLFRSVSAESESGYRVTLVRSDKFDFKTDKYELTTDEMHYDSALPFNKLSGNLGVYTRDYYKNYQKSFDKNEELLVEKWEKKYNLPIQAVTGVSEEAKRERREIGLKAQKQALKEVGSLNQHLKDNGMFDLARQSGLRLIVEKTDRYDENKYFPTK